MGNYVDRAGSFSHWLQGEVRAIGGPSSALCPDHCNDGQETLVQHPPRTCEQAPGLLFNHSGTAAIGFADAALFSQPRLS